MWQLKSTNRLVLVRNDKNHSESCGWFSTLFEWHNWISNSMEHKKVSSDTKQFWCDGKFDEECSKINWMRNFGFWWNIDSEAQNN